MKGISSLEEDIGQGCYQACPVLTEPTFISTSWVKRQEDPDNEKIYVFFREKNSDSSLDADPWISRVARVCKVS